MTRIEKAIAVGTLVTMIAAVILQQFWWVPYYIESQVETAVKAELHDIDFDDVDTVSSGNAAKLEALSDQLTRIETQMVERDRLFIEYLERQAQ